MPTDSTAGDPATYPSSTCPKGAHMGLSDCECGGFIALGPDASNKCDKCGAGVFDHAHKPCTWAEDSDGIWNAACPPVGEHSFCFTDEGPTENGFKFCCYCGKPIEVIPFDAND